MTRPCTTWETPESELQRTVALSVTVATASRLRLISSFCWSGDWPTVSARSKSLTSSSAIEHEIRLLFEAAWLITETLPVSIQVPAGRSSEKTSVKTSFGRLTVPVEALSGETMPAGPVAPVAPVRPFSERTV
jgi:hypothetical protein